MSKHQKLLSIPVTTFLILGLSGCSSLSIDKERATEQRKQELCTDISTRDLPHCSGN